jgi:serine phosphatase RsbU (regulator of sigma subunit)/CHASE2 domain-containing sensor protein
MLHERLPGERGLGITATYWLIILAAIAACTAVRQADPGFMARLRLLGFDILQQARPRPVDPAYPVRVIDIDESSMREFGPWPWRRDLLAQLTERLASAGVRVVVFDVVFPDATAGPLDQLPKTLRELPELAPFLSRLVEAETPDETFAKAIAAHPTVLGVIGTSRAGSALPEPKASFATIGENIIGSVPSFAGASGNLPAFEGAAAGIGVLNWLPDHDQILRRIPLVVGISGQLYPSLVADALRVFSGTRTVGIRSAGGAGTHGISTVAIGKTIIPTDRDGQLWLWFSRHDPSRSISAGDVLGGRVPKGNLEGRIAVVGTSAPGLLDLRATPLDPVIAGVEINAQALEQLLSARLLVRPDYAVGIEIVLAIFASIGLALLAYLWGARISAAVGFASVLMLSLGSLWAFSRGVLLDAVFPIMTSSVAYVVGSAYLYYEAESERNRGRAALRRFSQEMEAAAQIQRAFLPKEALADPSTAKFEICALMKPARAVGGDFYDYFLIDNANKVGIAVGDVSGKGVPAALFMSVSRTVLRTVAFEHEEPGLVLSKVNAILAQDNSEGMFVTIFYAVLDLATGILTFSSGGHDDAVLRTASGSSERLGYMGPAIGLIDTAEYPTASRSLAAGDTILLLTDGITEAFDPNGRVFGGERVLDILARQPHTSASDIVHALTQEVARFSAGAEQSDDITCLALRFKG